MALDFLPFTSGTLLTPDLLNELVGAIQNGTIFTDTSYISGLLAANSATIAALTVRVSNLEAELSNVDKREQFQLVANQLVVGLSSVPNLDSEVLFLNGMGLSKTGTPAGFVGDYSISGSTITLNSDFYSLIDAGDLLVVKYSYGV